MIVVWAVGLVVGLIVAALASRRAVTAALLASEDLLFVGLASGEAAAVELQGGNVRWRTPAQSDAIVSLALDKERGQLITAAIGDGERANLAAWQVV